MTPVEIGLMIWLIGGILLGGGVFFCMMMMPADGFKFWDALALGLLMAIAWPISASIALLVFLIRKIFFWRS